MLLSFKLLSFFDLLFKANNEFKNILSVSVPCEIRFLLFSLNEINVKLKKTEPRTHSSDFFPYSLKVIAEI